MSNRTILHPELYGGNDCEGTAFRKERCNAQACPKVRKPKPLDCKWSEYNVWTQCSKTCGWGVKTSERIKSQEAIHGGKECTGDEIITEKCKLKDCPGAEISIKR